MKFSFYDQNKIRCLQISKLSFHKKNFCGNQCGLQWILFFRDFFTNLEVYVNRKLKIYKSVPHSKVRKWVIYFRLGRFDGVSHMSENHNDKPNSNGPRWLSHKFPLTFYYIETSSWETTDTKDREKLESGMAYGKIWNRQDERLSLRKNFPDRNGCIQLIAFTWSCTLGCQPMVWNFTRQ